MNQEIKDHLSALKIPLERDVFLRDLLRHLSGTLEEVVGLSEAAGFISLVGQRVGNDINELYRGSLSLPVLNREQVAGVLADLKQRIQGDFEVEYEDDERIVLRSKSCPFGDRVKQRTSLCMMTSNVFGTITSENLGYAKVAIESSIARGDTGCRVTVYIQPSEAANAVSGVEYYKAGQ